jgi:hypothetical protein
MSIPIPYVPPVPVAPFVVPPVPANPAEPAPDAAYRQGPPSIAEIVEKQTRESLNTKQIQADRKHAEELSRHIDGGRGR